MRVLGWLASSNPHTTRKERRSVKKLAIVTANGQATPFDEL